MSGVTILVLACSIASTQSAATREIFRPVEIAANQFPSKDATYKNLRGVYSGGTLRDVQARDGKYFSIDASFMAGAGHFATVRFKFDLDRTLLIEEKIEVVVDGSLVCKRGKSFFLFVFNQRTKEYEFIGSSRMPTSERDSIAMSVEDDPKRFIDHGGRITLAVRVNEPMCTLGSGPEPFILSIDKIALVVRKDRS